MALGPRPPERDHGVHATRPYQVLRGSESPACGLAAGAEHLRKRFGVGGFPCAVANVLVCVDVTEESPFRVTKLSP